MGKRKDYRVVPIKGDYRTKQLHAMWDPWLGPRRKNGNWKTLLGQLRKYEYGCILDDSIVVMLNFLSVISVLWIWKSGPACMILEGTWKSI